jgi:hypothetical protein
VFIKFINEQYMQSVLNSTNGTKDFRHKNGEVSHVQIERAGMGKRKICVVNLPPEVPDHTHHVVLEQFGEVQGIQEDQWARQYRYRVSNGVRIVSMGLKQHIHSHLQVGDNRVLITYEGQPLTCHGCNGVGHQHQQCPNRRRDIRSNVLQQRNTWANIVTNHNSQVRTSHKTEQWRKQRTIE